MTEVNGDRGMPHCLREQFARRPELFDEDDGTPMPTPSVVPTVGGGCSTGAEYLLPGITFDATAQFLGAYYRNIPATALKPSTAASTRSTEDTAQVVPPPQHPKQQVPAKPKITRFIPNAQPPPAAHD